VLVEGVLVLLAEGIDEGVLRGRKRQLVDDDGGEGLPWDIDARPETLGFTQFR
jgi:hypothetical protein